MKKVFISVPMKGRTDEAISKSIEKMHAIAEVIFDEKLEVIHNHCSYSAEHVNNMSLYCLGHAIQKMAEADYFIGIRYSDYFKGCDIEASVASKYGIKSFYLDIFALDFLNDAAEIERKYHLFEEVKDQ